MADTPAAATAYVWSFNETVVTNYLKSSSGTIFAESAEGNSVRYSFDYYIPSTGNFTAKNSDGAFITTAFKGVVNESTTGSSFLASGQVGHVDVSNLILKRRQDS